MLLAVCSPGLAAPTEDPSKAQNAEAELSKAERAEERALREFMRAGIQEAEANNWEGAVRAYRSAWQIRKHFAIAMSLAEAEMKLENYLAAAQLWQFYLENVPDEARDPELDAQEELAKCRAELGSVQVTIDGPPAVVLINDEQVGETPLESEVWLKPGDYEIKARRGTEWTKPHEVALSAGSRVKLALEFSEIGPEGIAAPLPAGDAGASVATSSSGVESSSFSPRTAVLIGGGVLTIAAAAVGAVYWTKFEKLDSDAARLRSEIDQSSTDPMLAPGSACNAENKQMGTAHPRCEELDSTVDEQDDAADWARVMLGTAGVLGAATVATYFLWPEEPDELARSETKLSVMPWVAPSSTGFQLRGAF